MPCIRRAQETPLALNGSGYTPAAASVEGLSAGTKEISATTPDAVTVPGAVDSWCRLHTDYGSLALDKIFHSAIDAAENGFRVTPRVAFDWERMQSRLRVHEAARKHYLPGDQPPDVGERLAQPALGATLRRIARQGKRPFMKERWRQK